MGREAFGKRVGHVPWDHAGVTFSHSGVECHAGVHCVPGRIATYIRCTCVMFMIIDLSIRHYPMNAHVTPRPRTRRNVPAISIISICKNILIHYLYVVTHVYLATRRCFCYRVSSRGYCISSELGRPIGHNCSRSIYSRLMTRALALLQRFSARSRDSSDRPKEEAHPGRGGRIVAWRRALSPFVPSPPQQHASPRQMRASSPSARRRLLGRRHEQRCAQPDRSRDSASR